MDSTRRNDCAEYHDDLAVLAVGALTGHDRARVLAHLEGCPACTLELEELTAAADSLEALIPTVSPPEGFSQRTMARIRAEQPARHTSVLRRALAVAAAVILLALAGGVGAAIEHSAHQAPASTFASAPLGSRHGTEGSVVLVSSGGKGWLVMTVHDAPASGLVSCTLTFKDGSHQTVGTFRVSDGYGSWTAPITPSISSVQWVDVVSASGATLASARIW